MSSRFSFHLSQLTFPSLFTSSQHSVEFGQGILNNGKAKGREKRPLTQIEIMAAVEREKTEKKAAKRAVKVRARRPPPHLDRRSVEKSLVASAPTRFAPILFREAPFLFPSRFAFADQ